MRESIQIPVSLRVALIGISILFLTLSPRPRLLQNRLDGVYWALENDSPSQAASRLAVVLAFEPWRTELRLAAGRYAAQGGDYPAAVEFLESASKRLELPMDDWLVLGDAYLALGKDFQAVSAWQEALERGADQLAVTRRLLQVHEAQDNFIPITQDLKVLADLQPENAQAQYQAGIYLAAFDPWGA